MKWNLKHSATLGVVLPVILLAILLLSSCATAFGDFLSNSWDLVDINGGYNTSTYPDYEGKGTWAQMGSYIGGQHKITGVSVNFYPQYQYEYDSLGNIIAKKLNGYQIQESIYGEISTKLTLADIGHFSQSNSFDARGIKLSESASMDCYNIGSNKLVDLRSNGNANISILNFKPLWANGNYHEYSGNGWTSFNYNVSWFGDFLPATVPSGAVFSGMGTSVPEPSTLCMLFGLTAIGGVIIWRRKR